MRRTDITGPGYTSPKLLSRRPSVMLVRATQEVVVPGRSPKITELSWGSVETEAGKFRDAKLWPDGGRDWDWRETGTDHVPGVQPADVEELLNNGAEVVVVGRGQEGRLQVRDETLARIEDRGATAEVFDTRAAVERYNELSQQGVAVGALIHSTC